MSPKDWMPTFIPISGYTAWYKIDDDDGGPAATEALPVVAVAVDPEGQADAALVLNQDGRLKPVNHPDVRGEFLGVEPSGTGRAATF